MSYSDYGAYVWKRIDEEWSRWTPSEDTSVKNFINDNPPPTERPLEAATGLKFDVLLHAKFEVNSKEEWMFQHAHHAVVGDELVAVSCYKGSVANVFVDGVETDPDEVSLPEGYEFEYEEVHYRWSIGVIVYLKCPQSEWLAFVGYGIGNHWWLDAEGNEIDEHAKDRTWVREAECLHLAEMWLAVKEKNQ